MTRIRNRDRTRGFVKPATAIVMYGLQSFSSTAGYQTANGGGEQGHADGFGYAYILRVDTQGSSANRTVLSVNDATGTTHGYQERTQTTNASLSAQLRQSGGAGFTNGPGYTIGAGDVGKLFLVHVQFDPVLGELRRCIQGALNGTPTACAAYAVPDTSVPMSIGRLAAASAGLDGCTIFGLCTWQGVATSGEITAHYAAVRAANAMVAMAGATVTATHTYPVTSTTDATLTDITGASNATKQGSPTRVMVLNPPWV